MQDIFLEERHVLGDELRRVYERVDELCGELIDAAEALYGEEPTVLVFWSTT